MSDNNKKPKTIKVKDKDDNNKEYELEVKTEKQKKDGKEFQNVKDGPFFKSAEMIKSDKETKKLSGGPAPLFYIAIAVGAVALLALLYFVFFRKKKNKREEEIL